jgi:acetoin utilization deacetylase AcuC-like enzyme
MRVPVYFHPRQLSFNPRVEWTGGDRVPHPEAPERATRILEALSRGTDRFELREPSGVPEAALRGLHAPELFALYGAASRHLGDQALYPTAFPGRSGRADPHNLRHAGAWCFDAGTPLDALTEPAASWSAASAWEAAGAVLAGEPLAYALSRPPGHHASHDRFGGYCYFNNTALAASRLRAAGMRVAVVDLDFHHGDGTQALFWRDPSVFTASIHGDPDHHFPYHSGYADEIGEGPGEGANLNLPLEGGADGQAWLKALHDRLIPAVRAFSPDALVIAAGFDAYKLDPIGDFTLETEDFERAGAALRALGLPSVAVQEGGYHTEHLGLNAEALLRGLIG